MNHPEKRRPRRPAGGVAENGDERHKRQAAALRLNIVKRRRQMAFRAAKEGDPPVRGKP